MAMKPQHLMFCRTLPYLLVERSKRCSVALEQLIVELKEGLRAHAAQQSTQDERDLVVPVQANPSL